MEHSRLTAMFLFRSLDKRRQPFCWNCPLQCYVAAEVFMLLGGIGFHVLPPLTFRCLQQDSTAYSFPCYLWFRACNRCCQLPWFWCKQGYHKHCRGGNVPKQISRGRHEPQNLGLSSRKPYKQSEPRSQRGARSLPALALQLLTQPESKFRSLPVVGGSACVRPVSKGLQEQDHAVSTGTRARMLDVEAVLTDPWAHCFVQVVLWCSASTQKAHCNGDDQEMFISPVTL